MSKYNAGVESISQDMDEFVFWESEVFDRFISGEFEFTEEDAIMSSIVKEHGIDVNDEYDNGRWGYIRTMVEIEAERQAIQDAEI